MATVAAAATDAILVAEEWISEHYFTTDAKNESFTARVLARRKDWDGRKDEGTPRTRLIAARQRLLSTFATLTSDTERRDQQRRERADLRDPGLRSRRPRQRTARTAAADPQRRSRRPGRWPIIDARPAGTVEELRGEGR